MDETGFWRRVPIFYFLFFGFFMGFFGFYGMEGSLNARLLTSLFVALFSGSFYSLLMTGWQRRAGRRALDRIFAGDERLIGSPPPEADFPYKLPCGLHLSRFLCVGGVLYLGPSDVIFVPNRNNLPRHRTPRSVGAPAELRVSRTLVPLTFIGKLVVKRRPAAMGLTSRTATHRFIVPDIENTLPVVENTLTQLALST